MIYKCILPGTEYCFKFNTKTIKAGELHINYTTVLVERKEHVGIITLNKPDNYNIFNIPMTIDLNDALINGVLMEYGINNKRII